jgi:dienelactone hydrolase
MTLPGDQIRDLLAMAEGGRFDEIRALFADELQPLVTADALRAAWESEMVRVGRMSFVGEPLSDPGPHGSTVVRVLVTTEHGAFALVGSLTQAGRLTGLQIAPPSAAQAIEPWQPPSYADPALFAEEEVSVGEGPLSVLGTLAIPVRPRPCPAVVLLAGSGPNDRDETVGRNKALKDLAWGLASLGIAVLRFDKVTLAHPEEVKADPDFTVADEYVSNATAAVGILLANEAVDNERVFFAGHSLGGTVCPRVVLAEPRVAGMILLAAGNEPLQWAAVRQVEYLASLDPTTAAASESAIRTLIEQAKRVDSPDLSASTPSGELPFGTPAPYWLDLRAYDPVATARETSKPMLLLQGARDYQVTVDGDLAAWRTGLAQHPDVTFRVYPDDNHFFFAGSGPSSPAELESAQHMDADVVRDVAAWMKDSSAAS